MYGEIILELSRMDFRPYSGQTMLFLICTTLSRVDHARYEEPYAQDLGTCIWGPCYNSTLYATGLNARFRFIIKASYIVSTEGDVRRVTILSVEATDKYTNI